MQTEKVQTTTVKDPRNQQTSTLEPDFVTLVQGLRSHASTERISAMKQFQEIGSPKAVRMLTTHMRQQVEAYLREILPRKLEDTSRGIVNWIIVPPIFFIGLLALLIGLYIGSNVNGGPGGWHWCGAGVVIMSVSVLVSKLARRRWRVAVDLEKMEQHLVFAEVASAGAVIGLAPICQYLRHRDSTVKAGAADAATVLIHLSSDDSLKQLRGEAALALCHAVVHNQYEDATPFSEAALYALAAAGDESDLDKIELWLRSGSKANENETRSINRLRVRIELEKLTNSLLRPSTQADSEVLLRPSSYGEEDQALLLRPGPPVDSAGDSIQ